MALRIMSKGLIVAAVASGALGALALVAMTQPPTTTAANRATAQTKWIFRIAQLHARGLASGWSRRRVHRFLGRREKHTSARRCDLWVTYHQREAGDLIQSRGQIRRMGLRFVQPPDDLYVPS